MKTPDLEKERSEQRLSLSEFMESYNGNLPSSFPRASLPALRAFKKAFPALFKDKDDTWSLEQHRKKFMDWLPQFEKSRVA